MPPKVNKRVGRGAKPTKIRISSPSIGSTGDKGPTGKPIKALGDEQASLEERWHAWQVSPAAKGKGTASILEYICWDWLVNRKKLKQDVDFLYQVPMAGGRNVVGGQVVDFYFPDRFLAWNPAGLRFHFTTTQDRIKDQLAKLILGGRGITYVYLWEDDLMNRREYTLEQALKGREVGWRRNV